MSKDYRLNPNGQAVQDRNEEDMIVKKPIINPLASPYYNDSIVSLATMDGVATHPASFQDTHSKASPNGWGHADTMAAAAPCHDLTKRVQSGPVNKLSADNLTLTTNKVKPQEVANLLKNEFDKFPEAICNEAEQLFPQKAKTPESLKAHMEALSTEINKALQSETCNFEKIHAMVLRFCMIHMRDVIKDDQEYLTQLRELIKVQSGTIRDTYNTWPVVAITLTSSAISIIGGVAGFSSFIVPGSELAEAFAKHAQQISSASTGISGVGSLLSSRNEGDRQVLQLVLKRDQDKEDEKKGAKHGNKESQKMFRTAIEEFFRNIRDTISSILRG